MFGPLGSGGKVSFNKQLRWVALAASGFALAMLLAYFLGSEPDAGGGVVEESAGNAPISAGNDSRANAAVSAGNDSRASEPVREEATATARIDARSPGQPAAAPDPGLENAWRIVDPESVDELPPYKEVAPGRVLVRVSEALRLGLAGDRIGIHVPQLGWTFEGIVERSETDAYGNVSHIGLLRESDGRDYRFVITAGARNTFAHIGTSRGTYELVASRELGWLMPTAGMDQHVDYSRPDYIIPEGPMTLED